MSFFQIFQSKNTPEKVAEFRRSPQDLNAAAASVQRAQAMGDDWDVVDDPDAERMGRALAEQAQRQAQAEAARQEAERQRHLMELMAAQQRERELIARQARVEGLVITAAANLRNLAQTSSARWEALVREHSQAQQEVDKLHLEAECWRCGQQGRLPVEDAELLGSWTMPPRPAGAHYDTVMHAARQLMQARKGALEAWRRYNDRRLEVEWLRVQANFHPAVSDRLALERDCEVCGSRGIFHARRLAWTSEYMMYHRWLTQMHGHSAYVTPLVGFNKWVPVEKLTRDQAKAWLRAPRQRANSSDDWRKYETARKEWDEKVANRTIRPAPHNDSIALLGRANVGTHVEVTVADGKVTHTRVSEPARPSHHRVMDWPHPAYWTQAYPDRWKGGPEHDLLIKPGVVYPPDKQDPLSKEPRIKPVPAPPAPAPTEALLRARQNFWAAAP
ncbi:MAG: hypothetical protein KF796_05040 [Ramlibacter sp.]|nr:hypothetical protein [Ramlibacter sp.]